MFLSDHVASFARKTKQTDEKRSTLREKIIGRTNAGKAFRVGSLISGVGLAGLALTRKGGNPNYKVKLPDGSFLNGQHSTNDVKESVLNRVKNYYTRDVHDLPHTVKTTISHGKVKHPTKPSASGRSEVIDVDNVRTRKPGTFWEDDYKNNLDLFDTSVRETYGKDIEKGFLGTDRKVRWGRVGKTAGIGAGALALPTVLAYAAGSKKDKEDIERRVNNTAKSGSKSLESTRRLVNTLHRVSR
jgi:hypothetical protein